MTDRMQIVLAVNVHLVYLMMDILKCPAHAWFSSTVLPSNDTFHVYFIKLISGISLSEMSSE